MPLPKFIVMDSDEVVQFTCDDSQQVHKVAETKARDMLRESDGDDVILGVYQLMWVTKTKTSIITEQA